MNESSYLEINKELWNQRTEVHLTSDFYAQERFLQGENSLKSIEMDLLGEVAGKSALHLQCHFGQDTVSLSRMGADATGVDFSEKAIGAAREIAEKLAVRTRFICADIYSLPEHLDAQFDVVFTSYGTVGWLPDLDRWAAVVQQYLKPGGRFVFVEFHPVVWMFDDDFENVAYPYLKSDPIIENTGGTYADTTAPMQAESVSWNHGLSEVISSLLKQGLVIQSFQEFDYSPYNCFRGTVEFEPGKFRIEKLGNKIPMVYSLVAQKPEA